MKGRNAFTLAEVLTVTLIVGFILYFAYNIFFSQTRVVTQGIDSLNTNEGFRRVMAFMGDDIKEATRIVKPTPVALEDVNQLVTTTGSILIVQSSSIDPRISFDSPLGGQIEQLTTIEYELEPMTKMKDGKPYVDETSPKRYRLVRNAKVEEKNGEQSRQRQVVADNIKELIVFRTVRKPFKAMNVESLSDKLIQQMPLSEAGTGNSLIHVKMVIERRRSENEKNKENIYSISMNTSFYKRGKEIFLHP